MMYIKIWLYTFFFVQLLHNGIDASQKNTCGAAYEGELFEDFHGGHNYVSYDIEPQHLYEDSIEYQDTFCTKNEGGVIAQLISDKNEENIIVEVINGQIGVELLHENVVKPECVFILNKTVTDGVYYRISLQIKGVQLILNLSRQNTEILIFTVLNIGACLDGNFSTFNHLEKGGIIADAPPHARTYSREAHENYKAKPNLYKSFDGCIGDSMINGVPLNKASSKVDDHADPSCLHKFDSQCTSACATTFISTKEGHCVCPDDSEINDVGLCVRTCTCVVCQNGGSCITASGSDTVCKCTPGYMGRFCEEKVNLCVGVVCMNGGSCLVTASGPVCDCLPEFTGSWCEVFIPPDPCKESPCQNNATCERNSTYDQKFSCTCLGGYYGRHCESEINNVSQMEGYKIGLIPFGAAAFVILIVVLIYLRGKYRSKADSDNEQQEVSADAKR